MSVTVTLKVIRSVLVMILCFSSTSVPVFGACRVGGGVSLGFAPSVGFVPSVDLSLLSVVGTDDTGVAGWTVIKSPFGFCWEAVSGVFCAIVWRVTTKDATEITPTRKTRTAWRRDVISTPC